MTWYQKTICAVLALLGFLPLTAGELQKAEEALYTEALELIIAEEEDEAVLLLEELVTEYPESVYTEKARNYINQYKYRLDHSGIVPFYAGNLLTSLYTALNIPLVFDAGDNAFAMSLSGILGITSGLWSSWYFTKDRPITSDHEMWIANTQILSTLNYQYLYAAFSGETEREYRLNAAGQTAVLLGSRIGAYNFMGDKHKYNGNQAFFMMNGYAWANYYYYSIGPGLLEMDDTRMIFLGALAATDAGAWVSYKAWEELRWSGFRTGIVSVGGAGGMLIGFFASMFLASADLMPDEQKGPLAVTMAGALAGKLLTTHLTRDWYKREAKHSEGKTNGYSLTCLPAVTPRGATGIRLVMQY